MRRAPSLSAVLLAVLSGCMPPSWGAGALLHPSRRPMAGQPVLAHQDVAFDGDGVVLRGWLFPAAGGSRGTTVVYLHGVGDRKSVV